MQGFHGQPGQFDGLTHIHLKSHFRFTKDSKQAKPRWKSVDVLFLTSTDFRKTPPKPHYHELISTFCDPLRAM